MQDQSTKPTKGKFLPKKNKKTKRIVTIAVIVAVLAAVLILPGLLGGGKEVPQLDLTDTTVLTYTDLRSTISATGTVESAESTTVYSTVAYPVMAVHVEVGDYVHEGDLLAELDDHSIQNQITSQEINLDLSTQSSNQQVQSAQDNYNNFKSGIDQGLNATLNGARNQAETAYETYEKAQLTYDRYVASLADGENTALINAEAALRNARNTLDSAEDACNAALEAAEDAEAAYLDAQWNEKVELDNQNMILTKLKEERDSIQAELDSLEYLRSQDQANLSAEDLERLHELEAKENTLKEQLSDKQEEINRKTLEVISLETAYNQIVSAYEQADAQVETARNALNRAAEAYDTQLATFRATNTTVDNTLADYLTNVQTAWDNYQEALTSLAATEKTVNEQLKTYENNVTSAQIGANKAAQEESLRQLKENLDDTQVTAPVSGTVTAVYAKVGGSGSGLLFVIENVDELIVDTSVKGYDVGTVQTGMKVLIRSDATGDAEMDGTITSIAPTSNKNAMGLTDTTGEAVFAAEVAVNSKDTGLRIGMEAQLDYILEEQSHVLAVPYDAVYQNETGETCILIAEPVDDADHYLIRSIPVTTGMDDDLDMVVTGPEIREGLVVINEADAYLELLGQTVLAATGIHADLIAAMMGG